jgi:hypothetical protein
LAEEIGFASTAPLLPVGEGCGLWEGRRDRVFRFALCLDRLPALRLDNREIIAAHLVSRDDLQDVPLTGPVGAYVDGRLSPCSDCRAVAS